jgi:hypothetical protein
METNLKQIQGIRLYIQQDKILTTYKEKTTHITSMYKNMVGKS